MMPGTDRATRHAGPASLPVLLLAPVEPWCRENGSSVIIADMLEGLARLGDAHVLPVFLRPPPKGLASKPPQHLPSVTLGVPGLPRWVSVTRALARRSSPMLQRFDNRTVAARIIATAHNAGFTPRLVHVEHLPLVEIGVMVARAWNCPLVYRAHNVEAVLMVRRLGVAGALGRTLLRRLEHAEARAIESCQLALCISDVDLAWVRAHAPRARAELFPCTLLLDRYDELPPVSRDADLSIAFVGGLEWAPNEVGLRWFVSRVLPRIVDALPQARLRVLARGAASRRWIRRNPAIRILPEDADARSLFASSRVSIAPLLQGGGVRIKIPESLALGCPVVATRIGAEGLNLPGLTATDDPDQFAHACLQHLAEPESRPLGERLRAAVQAQHGANVLAERLVDVWQQVSAAEGPGVS